MYFPKNKNYLFLLFIFFLFLYRYLLPFGDEPDFWIRAKSFVEGVSLPDTPYNILKLDFLNFIFNKADYLNLKCQFFNHPFTIWPKISHSLCTPNIKQIIIRVSITLILSTPLFLYLFYKYISYKLGYSSSHKLKNTSEIVFLCLFTPSVLFHIGFLSIESFILSISFILILAEKDFFIVIIALLIIFLSDFGQFLIVSLAYIIILISKFYYHHFKLVYFYIFLISFIFIALSIKFIFINDIIFYISSFKIDFLDYIARNLRHILNFKDSYPTILRPIITYMGFVFYTPFFIKIIPLYILFTLAILIKLYDYYFYSFINNSSKDLLNENFFVTSNLIITVILIVIIFPPFSQAKYYIFIFPIIYKFLLTFTPFKNIMIFLMISNLLVFISLILFRII